jgi:hypothetical protein
MNTKQKDRQEWRLDLMSVNEIKNSSGFLGPEPKQPSYQYQIIDNQPYRIVNIAVHRFKVADSEDPEIYAAEPIWQWQQSEAGQWVMEHAIESPVWHRSLNAASLHHDFVITAKLKEKDYTFWALKWA